MLRRAHRIILLFVLLLGCAGMNYVQAAVYNGNCGANGSNLTWSFNTSTAKLTISGTGAMANYSTSSRAPWYTYRGSITTITIANTVTSIGDYAFNMCANVTSVSIGTGVTSIGNSAFYNCSSLTSVTIPNGVITIGDYAFCNCTHLASFSIPSNVTTIGSFAFSRTALTSITIPNKVTYIAQYIFYHCEELKTVTLGNKVTTIDANAFDYCTALTSITIPSTVTAIRTRAFLQCEKLTSITIPSSVTTLGSYAFQRCKVLKDIYVGWTSSIPAWNNMTDTSPQTSITLHVPCGTRTKYGAATGWKDYTIASPASYTLTVKTNSSSYGTVKINDGATGATKSESIFCGEQATITAVLTTSNCNVDFLQWNDGVKDNPRTVTVDAAITYTAQFGTIGGNCGASGNNLTWSFNRCTGVLTISGSGDMEHYTSSPQPWASYISYINSVVLPEGITSIGIRAFKNHTALSSINLPSTLTNIGLEAFRATALTSVEIPSGIQGINYWTFKDCASLTKVRLPASITSLPTPGAFCGCTSLQFVYVSWETASQIPTCSNTSNFFHDLTTKPTLYVPCGTISLYQNKGWNNKFTITDVLLSGTCGSNLTWSLNTCGVLTISGTGAMSNYPGMNMPWRSRRASITSVVISDGVTSIGYNAFNGCSNLTSVTIPPSVTSIEQNAFYGCYAMESLYITDLAAWCNVEFGVSVEATPFMRNNYNSGSTEYLGGGNLYLNGTLVTTLTIPDGITEIKNLTFLGCSSITSIDFNQVTTIGSASFKGCHGLTSVTLPEGVTSLKNAFPYCTQLQSISIPASLTSLARQTLYHSDALTDIYVYWTDNIPGWPEYFTAQSPQPSITLHVPCGTEELYNTTANWKKYTIEADGGSFTITVQAADPTMGDVNIIVN